MIRAFLFKNRHRSLTRRLITLSTIGVMTAYGAALCACSTSNSTLPGLGGASPGIVAAPDSKTAGSVVLVTDSGTNEASTYAYPSGKFLQTLPGSFSEPQGVCSDGAGHFWIANTGDSNIIEYSADGSMVGTLNDPNNYPVGCAYDPKTGDLAVTNIVTTGDGPGSIGIYAKAKGLPKVYSVADLQRVYFAAYAGSTGTLVVAGETQSYSAGLATFKDGKSKALS
jgi:hypothetical protein